MDLVTDELIIPYLLQRLCRIKWVERSWQRTVKREWHGGVTDYFKGLFWNLTGGKGEKS